MSNAIKKAHKELQKYMAQGYTMSSAEKNLLNALGNNKELYKEFILKSNEFHDKYIHISHDISSISDSLGMQAQRESLGTDTILHRDYFTPKKIDMAEFNTSAQPSKFLILAPFAYFSSKLIADTIKFTQLKNVKFEGY